MFVPEIFADQLLEMARSHDPKLELKYNKAYIDLAEDGEPRIFIIFRPTKGVLRFEPRLPNSEPIQEQLEASGLDVMAYDKRWGRYRIRLQQSDLDRNIFVR